MPKIIQIFLDFSKYKNYDTYSQKTRKCYSSAVLLLQKGIVNDLWKKGHQDCAPVLNQGMKIPENILKPFICDKEFCVKRFKIICLDSTLKLMISR